MPITEAELRDLLARDSDGAYHRQVTVADVHRRARRIRRRRLAAAGAALATGLATAGIVAAPHTVTAEVPDDIWTAVMAQPSPARTELRTYVPGPELVQGASEVGGRKQRFSYTSASESVSVELACGKPSYAFLWINGHLVDEGPCGIQSDNVQYIRRWVDEFGYQKAGRNVVEIAIVPAERVPEGLEPGDPVAVLSGDQADRLIDSIGDYPVHTELTVTGMFTVIGGGDMGANRCHGDIVIHKSNGQEIHTSKCDRPAGGNPFPAELPGP